MKKIMILMMSALLIFGMMSCKNNIGLGDAIGGTVLLTLDDGVTQRTIGSSQDMDIFEYDIHATYETGYSFDELGVAPGSNVVLEDMDTGEWTIVIEGKSSDGTVIGTGTNVVDVTPTSQSQVTVTITPIAGTGTLNVDVDWTVEADIQVDSPNVVSKMFSYTGTVDELIYTVDLPSRTANYNGDFSQGYYTLITQFVGDIDNGTTIERTVVAGNAEVVRIVTGATSSGSYTYDNVNTGGLGEVEIIISPELGEPLDIVLTPNVDGVEYKYRDTFTMDAFTSSTTDLVEYVWYVNGVEYQTGSTLNYDTRDFPKPGRTQTLFTNISVIGFSNAGTRGGSTSINITTVR